MRNGRDAKEVGRERELGARLGVVLPTPHPNILFQSKKLKALSIF
jgi:hypothetical protein